LGSEKQQNVQEFNAGAILHTGSSQSIGADDL
jgi:hypothetical protein